MMRISPAKPIVAACGVGFGVAVGVGAGVAVASGAAGVAAGMSVWRGGTGVTARGVGASCAHAAMQSMEIKAQSAKAQRFSSIS